MAHYKITLTFDGTNIATVRNKVAKMFGEDAAARVDKLKTADSRADRLSEVESTIEDAKSEVEMLRDELQEWYDNLPENLQSGTKADELQEAIDELENIISSLEDVDCSSVTFPGMY